MPTSSAANDELRQEGGTVTLFSASASATKWAPRWLRQQNIETTVVAAATDALMRLRKAQPDAVIVDAGMAGESGKPLYCELLDAMDLGMPIFVRKSRAHAWPFAL